MGNEVIKSATFADLHLSEEDNGGLMIAEPASAMTIATEQVIPDSVTYAHIENGVLQVTHDIEEEIAAANRGEVVSMGEFKTMFAKWL